MCPSLLPRHSWLGCAVWACVLGLASRLRPATPGWGVRCGCVSLGSGFGCAPPLLAGVLGCVCACPGWGVRCGCVCFSSGFGCAPPLLAGMLGFRVCLCAPSACTLPLLAGVCGVGVCAWTRVSAAPRHSWLGCWGVRVCVRSPLVPRHSWLGCAVWACVLGLGFQLRPATPGRGVGVCVCLCVRSACTPPLLAGVCGVGVCAWTRVSAAPRHSWQGCWGVCVLVCALRLYPATPGRGVRCGCVCLGLGFGCAPPLLVEVLGCVCACVCAPLVPHHSWLGCVVCICVLGLGFRLCPATPGWGFRVLCVLVCALCLYPATPGWGVRRGPVCLGSGFGWALPPLALVLGCACSCARSACTPPLLTGVCVLGLGLSLRPATPGWGTGVCVFVCVLRLNPATPGWGVRAWARVSAAPHHSLLGCWGVRVCVRAPLVPRHSWLGCATWVCVLGLGFWLRPASPGWGVGFCVCLCACSACSPPLLAGLCGVGVCAWARGLAAPRNSWLGCRGVCVPVCVARLYPATPGWGSWCPGLVLPGTCSRALVRCVLCSLPGFPAPGGRCCLAPVRVPWLWPASCLSGVPGGPALVRCASSRPVALGAPVGFPDAVVPFATPGAQLGGCAGHAVASQEPGSLCLPLAPAKAGAPGSLRIVPVQGPAMGLSLAGLSGVGLRLRALRWFVCVDPVYRALIKDIFPVAEANFENL